MHTLNLSGNNKSERYAELLPQIAALIAGETDLTANLANTAAVLKEAFSWLWVGFYLVRDNDLVLGPFQGPLACSKSPPCFQAACRPNSAGRRQPENTVSLPQAKNPTSDDKQRFQPLPNPTGCRRATV